MAELIIPSILRYLNFIQGTILLSGTIIAFSVAAYYNHVTLYVPFISDTGALVPELNIFSSALILGCISGLALILYRYVLIFLTTSDDKKAALKLNKIACLCGILSMFGLAGVAAFPVTTVFSAHIGSAAIFFGGVLLYIIFTTFYAYKSGITTTRLLKFRVILSILSFLALTFLIILFPISFKNWLLKNDVPPAFKLPEDEGFTLIFISACLEWLYMGLFLLYLAFINKDLPRENLKLMIASNVDRSETEVSTPVVSSG